MGPCRDMAENLQTHDFYFKAPCHDMSVHVAAWLRVYENNNSIFELNVMT